MAMPVTIERIDFNKQGANVAIGHKTTAFSSDPGSGKKYEFRYKVTDLYSIVPSHTDTLEENKDYPQELQPRKRNRSASRQQVNNMAENLNPAVLLRDSGFLDTGPMIVGDDGTKQPKVKAAAQTGFAGMGKEESQIEMLPETRSSKRKVSIRKVRSKHENRSSRAQAIDNSLQAQTVLPLSDKEIWIKSPNRFDINGIDTPPKHSRSAKGGAKTSKPPRNYGVISQKKGKMHVATSKSGAKLYSRHPIKGQRRR